MDKTNGRYVFLYNGLTGCLTKPLGHMHINFIVCKKKEKKRSVSVSKRREMVPYSFSFPMLSSRKWVNWARGGRWRGEGEIE